MPWMPEAFTGPLAQAPRPVEDAPANDAIAYYEGIMAGEPEALVRSFAARQPVLDDPRVGYVEGARQLRAFVNGTAEWLRERVSERFCSSVTTSFSRSRGISNTSPPSRTTAERYIACPVSMFRSPTNRPACMTPIVRASPAKSSITSTSTSRTTMKSLEVSPALKRTCPTSVFLVSP